MGFTELLTIIFVLLKVFGVVSWSWWVVFLPEIVGIVLYIILFVIGVYAQNRAMKGFNKHFKDF